MFLSIQGAFSLSAGFNTVGTLPEGFRPAHGKYESGVSDIRVTGVVKKLGASSADSTGTVDVMGSGLVRIWVPTATNTGTPTSGQVFFDTDQ